MKIVAGMPLGLLDLAGCREEDPGLFFRADGEPADAWEARAGTARAVCAACPVVQACHAWAMEHRPAGIWAGLDEHERTVLRRRARRSAASAGRAA